MGNHTNDTSREAYSEARRAFDDLKIEDKAIFMVESAFAMVIQGVEKLGAALSQQFADEADEAAPANATSESTADAKGTAGRARGTKKTTGSAKGKTSSTRSTRARKPRTDPPS